MTTKKNGPNGASGKTTPVMKVEKKNEVAKASTVEPKQPTVEELKKQVEELQKKVSAVPKDLDSRIEYFNQKKELIRKLTKLENNAVKLQEHLDAIAEISAADEFENDKYTLTIEGGERYNTKQVFALQNPVIIGEVISYMLGKVEAKAELLRKEIEE